MSPDLTEYLEKESTKPASRPGNKPDMGELYSDDTKAMTRMYLKLLGKHHMVLENFRVKWEITFLSVTDVVVGFWI